MRANIPEPMVRQSGASMLEVLVTLVIVAVALLGTAALQARAIQFNQSSQSRSQAVFLVGDLAERIEANKVGAGAGGYLLSAQACTGATVTNCSTSCTSTDLATSDLSQWRTAVDSTLPQSTCAVTRTVSGNTNTYTITVSWVDRRSDTTYETAGTGETLSYTATRMISGL